jgi:hypothetical protein
MKIYNYHSEYKYFISTSIADECQLEPGVFHIPAHATDIEPPEYEDGMISIFNETSWSILKDQRGTYYDISSGILQENNNPLEAPENTTKEQPPEVPEGKVLKWNNGWVLEDIPTPEPLTLEQKLASAGITLDELKAALGL